MLTLRQKIFITAGISAAIIIVIVLALFFFKDKKSQPINTNQETVTNIDPNVIDSNNPNIITNSNPEKISKPEGTPEELFVKQMARFFVERFYTYSNQNDNVHITELENSVTASMRTWMESQSLQQDTLYSGVTTKVLSSKLTSFDKTVGVASVNLEISQVFSKEGENGVDQETKTKSLDVKLESIEGEWKVAGVWDTEN